MRNGDGGSIQVTSLIPSQELDQYRVEVAIEGHLYHLVMRFSELRDLFKNVRYVPIWSFQETASFPSRCSLSTALLPLRSPNYREDFRRARLEELTCFFERISRGLTLRDCPEFWVLV
jgi:hypothetical protein